MMKTNIKVVKGEVYKVTVPANSTTVPNSAKIWLIGDGIQDQLISDLSASSEKILGPFLNDVTYRVEIFGSVTVEKMGDGSRIPVELATYLSQFLTEVPLMDSIDDAEDETDIVAQFNTLLASLRTAGYLAEPEE